MDSNERDRLIRLEATMKERWDNHDKRSDEIWHRIEGQVKAIFIKINGLTCQTHREKFKSQEKQMNWLWKLVSGIVLSMIGGFLWVIRK